MIFEEIYCKWQKKKTQPLHIDENMKEVVFRAYKQAYKQGLSLEIIKNLTDYSIQELNKILPEPEKELL